MTHHSLTLICLTCLTNFIFTFFFLLCIFFCSVQTRCHGENPRRQCFNEEVLRWPKGGWLQWQRRDPPPSSPPVESPLASSVAIGATKPCSPSLVPMGMRQKAWAVKPLKDLSDSTSLETLPSGPNFLLPTSPLSSPSKTMRSPWCVIGVHQSLKPYFRINLISIATSKGRSHRD